MKIALDPAIHAPVRLQVLAVLVTVQEAEFALLRDTAGVSDSVLSKHLSALIDAGYVKLRKAALDGRQRTWVAITGSGRRAFAGHVAALQQLVAVSGAAPASAPSPATAGSAAVA